MKETKKKSVHLYSMEKAIFRCRIVEFWIRILVSSVGKFKNCSREFSWKKTENVENGLEGKRSKQKKVEDDRTKQKNSEEKRIYEIQNGVYLYSIRNWFVVPK